MFLKQTQIKRKIDEPKQTLRVPSSTSIFRVFKRTDFLTLLSWKEKETAYYNGHFSSSEDSRTLHSRLCFMLPIERKMVKIGGKQLNVQDVCNKMLVVQNAQEDKMPEKSHKYSKECTLKTNKGRQTFAAWSSGDFWPCKALYNSITLMLLTNALEASRGLKMHE